MSRLAFKFSGVRRGDPEYVIYGYAGDSMRYAVHTPSAIFFQTIHAEDVPQHVRARTVLVAAALFAPV